MTASPRGRARRSSDVGDRSSKLAVTAALTAIALAGAGATASASNARPARVVADGSSSSPIVAVGAENEYANVIGQIGGPYVRVSAIMSNPNTDPHTFESTPSVAEVVSAAELIVQNGVGYDTFMNKIESASANPKRKVITVQTLLSLPDSTPNPHLWYSPKTMPAVAQAVAAALGELGPSHAAYFSANAKAFDKSLAPWLSDIAAFKQKYNGVPVATTEPVADYMLQAIGADNLTPFGMQADIMNGVDPSPEAISLQDNLFTGHKVKVFVYNQQVVDSLTTSFRTTAEKEGIPVVGVYETMPTPGYDYQTWMVAEVEALQKAVADKVSTERL
ncbi:MAG: zinc ABC transporter substrate-binding protein [Acidimicrobiales bacterium]|jgi:zinc/manganese transport system substrate-binding protein